MDELAPATESAEVVPQAETPQESAATGAPAPEAQQGTTEQDRAASEAARTLNERRQRNRENAERRVSEERDSYRRMAEMAMAALARGQQPTPQATPQQANVAAAPKREDFDSYDDYVEARAAFAAERRADEILQRRIDDAGKNFQRVQQEHQARAIENDHFTRTSQFARSVGDFADVTDRDDIVVPPAASEAIKRMADGPAILYTIGKNPEIVQHLARMEAGEQMVYLGQLSAYIRSQGSRLSNAAPAGRTVGAKPSGSTTLPDDTEAYMAAANKKFGRR